jgi:replicative DNA helicase
MDFTGKKLDIAKMFNLPGLDIQALPGQVIVVMGPTGAGKSALAQQMATEQNDLNSVYANLENGFEMMFRRNVQQVSGLSKDEVKALYKLGNADYEKHFNHITYVDTYSMELEDIHDICESYAGQFQMLIVDHIKLVETGSTNDYSKVGDITRGLKALALKHEIIIMEISQVSKDVARNNTWDALSGSGNGSIGHDADIVMAITGDNTEKARTIRILKNRDGDCTSFDAVMLPSLRIEKLAPLPMVAQNAF